MQIKTIGLMLLAIAGIAVATAAAVQDPTQGLKSFDAIFALPYFAHDNIVNTGMQVADGVGPIFKEMVANNATLQQVLV